MTKPNSNGTGGRAGEATDRRQYNHSVCCVPEIWQRLEKYAASQERMSTNFAAVAAITEYLDAHEGKAGDAK